MSDIIKIEKICIDITYQCPLRCKHCFAESEKITHFDEKIITQEDWDMAGQKLLELECIYNIRDFSLAGGEPLCAQNKLSALLRQLEKRKQAKCYILSSGIHSIHNYKVLRSVDMFYISLHYCNKEKQNAFAVNAHSFDKAIETISGLVKNNIKTAITMVAMNHSLPYIVPMYNLANLLSCDRLNINKVIISGRAQAELMISNPECEQIKAVALELTTRADYCLEPKIKVNGMVDTKNELHFQLEIMPDLSIGLRINGMDSMIHIIANLKEDVQTILQKIDDNMRNIQTKIRDNQIPGGNDGFIFEKTFYQ